MIQFHIPSPHLKAFEYYIALSDKLKEALAEGIKNAPEGLSPKKLSHLLSPKLEISESQLYQIIVMIYSFVSSKEESGIESDAFVEGVCESLKEENLQVTDKLKGQLKDLLSISQSIYLAMKAADLTTEREKLLIDTRILTDIRPVFGKEKEDEIKASIVTHNLKILYKERDGIKEIYLALDNEDLARLKENIQRAEKKEKAIKKMFKDQNRTIIEMD